MLFRSTEHGCHRQEEPNDLTVCEVGCEPGHKGDADAREQEGDGQKRWVGAWGKAAHRKVNELFELPAPVIVDKSLFASFAGFIYLLSTSSI